jgi:hypothetical protein
LQTREIDGRRVAACGPDGFWVSDLVRIRPTGTSRRKLAHADPVRRAILMFRESRGVDEGFADLPPETWEADPGPSEGSLPETGDGESRILIVVR